MSPSLDDANTMAAQGEAELAWAAPPAAAATSSPVDDDAAAAAASATAAAATVAAAPVKGKDKAAKVPLGLLDLPVDILKEIIHQVRAEPPSAIHPHGSTVLS